MSSYEQRVFADILAELERAREKHPGNDVTFIALVEELGEWAKAVLHLREKRDGTLSTQAKLREDAYREGIQTLVMCTRLITEGDGCTLYEGRFCDHAGCQQPHIGGPCALCYE